MPALVSRTMRASDADASARLCAKSSGSMRKSVKVVERRTTLARPAAETTCCAPTSSGSHTISRASLFATSAAVIGACVARTNGWKSTRSSFDSTLPVRLSCTMEMRIRAHVRVSIHTVPRYSGSDSGALGGGSKRTS
jgi:hypothetical protein